MRPIRSENVSSHCRRLHELILLSSVIQNYNGAVLSVRSPPFLYFFTSLRAYLLIYASFSSSLLLYETLFCIFPSTLSALLTFIVRFVSFLQINILLNFSAGEDCPCPEEIQEQLNSFHEELRLHCGTHIHIYIWLCSNSRQGSVKVLTFDYKEAFIIRLGYQSHWPWPDLVSDIIKRQQTNVLTYYTNTAVKGQCHWQFLKEMCVPLQESPLRKRRKNRTRR